MKALSKTILFIACAAAAVEHQALHMSLFGESLFTVGAFVAFVVALGDEED